MPIGQTYNDPMLTDLLGGSGGCTRDGTPFIVNSFGPIRKVRILLSIYAIDASYQCTLLTHPINTLSQPTLSRILSPLTHHPFSSPSSHPLPPHPLNPLTPPSQPSTPHPTLSPLNPSPHPLTPLSSGVWRQRWRSHRNRRCQ